MKILILLLTLTLASCNVSSEDPDPQVAMTIEQLETDLAAAEAANDEVEVERLRAELANFEAEVIRRRGGPILAMLSTTFPPLLPLAPFAGALLPLLGRRGRKHYWNAVKNVSPFVKGEDGSTEMSPVLAAMSILKGLGIKHSSPESEIAAETAPPPPQPV